MTGERSVTYPREETKKGVAGGGGEGTGATERENG